MYLDNQYICEDGEKISDYYNDVRCNYDRDCRDFSDEMGCPCNETIDETEYWKNKIFQVGYISWGGPKGMSCRVACMGDLGEYHWTYSKWHIVRVGINNDCTRRGIFTLLGKLKVWPYTGSECPRLGSECRYTFPDHFPEEGRSLPSEGQLHQKGPYLRPPEKGQNVLSGAVILYRISDWPWR